MVAHRGLPEAQDGAQFLDAVGVLGQQPEDGQPRAIGAGPEASEELRINGRAGQGVGLGHR